MQSSDAAKTKEIEKGKGFLTIRQLAEEIGLSPRTVWRFVQQRKVKTVRFGGSVRVPRKEAERVFTEGF